MLHHLCALKLTLTRQLKENFLLTYASEQFSFSLFPWHSSSIQKLFTTLELVILHKDMLNFLFENLKMKTKPKLEE